MNLHLALEHEWSLMPAEQRNAWQRLAARTGGIVTPGNVISLAGLALVGLGTWLVLAHGWAGIALIIAGRLADVVDGVIADKTGTKSPIGEAVDATIDKLAVVGVVLALLIAGLLPYFVGVYLLVRGVFTGILSILAYQRKKRIHPNRAGKLGTAAEWAMLAFVVASEVGVARGQSYDSMAFIGYVLLAVSFALAVLACRDYVRQYQAIRKSA